MRPSARYCWILRPGRSSCRTQANRAGGFSTSPHTPDGRFLAIAGYHPQIHLWRLKPHVIPAHEKEVWSLAFSPDGKSLASAALDHTVKLWDVASDKFAQP